MGASRLNLIFFMLVVLLLAGILLAYPSFSQPSLRAAATHYGPHSSAHAANRLAAALDSRSVGQNLGDQLLAALATPRVVLEDSYALGEPIHVTLNWPHDVKFKHLKVNFTQRFDVGHDTRKDFANRGQRELIPQDASKLEIQKAVNTSGTTVPPLEPGRYHLTLSLDVTLTDDQGAKAYAATIRLPIKFTVSASKQTTRIKLLSNPTLDHAMRAAFSAKQIPVDGTTQSFHHDHDRYDVSGGLRITYRDLPANVWLSGEFIDATGNVYPLRRGPTFMAFYAQHVAAKKGETGQCTITPFAFDFAKVPSPSPGTHRGHLVLTAWPKGAADDPAFKSIWGGTLRFAWHFTIQRHH